MWCERAQMLAKTSVLRKRFFRRAKLRGGGAADGQTLALCCCKFANRNGGYNDSALGKHLKKTG